MNKHIIISSSLALVLSAVQLQAYTFTVKNFTQDRHTVAIQLKGPRQKPVEAQTVEAYGATPDLFSRIKAQAEDAFNKFSNLLSDKLAQLNQDVDTMNADTLQNRLAGLQADIEQKVKAGVLKVGAKKWVNELNVLKNDVQNKLDRKKVARNLKKLQAEMDQKLANFSAAAQKATELDTATFSMGGISCVNKIIVDGNAVAIYGISPKHYDELQEMLIQDPRKFLGIITDNINARAYTDMTKTLVGICFSRQFDIIDLGKGKIIVITREKI